MKNTLLIVAFFVLSISAIGQTITSPNTSKEPFTLVDTFVTEMKYVVLSNDKIESVHVLKDSFAIAIYGNKAKNGAVIIKTKPNTVLLNMHNIISKYKISETDRKLRVCINKSIVRQPELILVDADEILHVAVTTEKNWTNAEDANSDESVINITTSGSKKKGL